jgi:hypothetical protein
LKIITIIIEVIRRKIAINSFDDGRSLKKNIEMNNAIISSI